MEIHNPSPCLFETIYHPIPSVAGGLTTCIHKAYDPRLVPWRDKDEPNVRQDVQGWAESGQKDLLENVGATGGFLVPIEQRTDLLQIPAPELVIRPRATRVPMRRRQIQWPTLDQTNTTAKDR